MEIMLAIDERTNYALKISKRIGSTISSILKSLKELIEQGYLIRKESGRIVYLELTKKGNRARDALLILKGLDHE